MDWTTMAADTDFTDADCIGWWQFDEGTSTAVGDSSSQSNDGTLNSAAWAGAGTFTKGSSTLVMAKNGTQSINYLNDFDVQNLTINDDSITELNCIDNTGGRIDVFGNLIVNEILKPTTTGTSVNATLAMKTGNSTLTIADYNTGMASLYRFTLDHGSGTITLPFSWHKRIVCSGSGGTTVQGSTLRVTEELQVNNNHTYNSSAYEIQFKVLDIHNGATVDFSGSYLQQKPDSVDVDISFGASANVTKLNNSGRGVASLGK